MLQNLRRSLVWSVSQRKAAISLSQRYPKETIDEWTEMRDKFDKDPASPNPYEEPKIRMFFVLLLTLVFPDTKLYDSRCYYEPTQT